MKTFKHSGARGDIIYGLPTIHALQGGMLYIVCSGGNYLSSPITDAEFEGISDFMRGQGIEVRKWSGEKVDFDLDKFRDVETSSTLLVEAHLKQFGVSWPPDKPWLFDIQPIVRADIVVSRTARYHGIFDWEELVPWAERCVFMGTDDEYAKFKSQTGIDIRRTLVSSWGEMAGVIHGSKLFVGNQSLPFAMAEAMKHPRALEVCLLCPNCDPRGADGYMRLSQDVIRKHLLGEQCDIPRYASRNPYLEMPFAKPFRKTRIAPPSIVIPVVPGAEFAELVVEAKKEGAEVVVVSREGSFESLANEGAAVSTRQIICVVDARFPVRYVDALHVAGQLEGVTTGMVGSCVSMSPRPHVSGPCLAVTRRAYERMGLFSPMMGSGRLNYLETTMRYTEGQCRCKSTGMPEWKGVAGDDEFNLRYIEKAYGVKL